MKSIQSGVKANLYNKDGKFLIIKRSKEETHLEGKWEIPGGRVEFGESPEEALREEVREETGLEISIKEPMNTWKFRKSEEEYRVGVDFLCETEKKDVKLSREHDAYRWVEEKELSDYDIYDSIQESLEKAIELHRGEKEIPKLVRDKIPEIIEENDEEAEIREVEGPELERFLRKKVLEEAEEFVEDREVEELADLLEVVEAYIENEGLDREKLDNLREEKNRDRGGFSEGFVLEDVD
jgi:mutator protein MutT